MCIRDRDAADREEDREARPVEPLLVVASLTAEREQGEVDLRAARDELALANAALEKKVEVRTTELREMVAELEHFSYAIVHDLRAPLRAMQGFAQVVEAQYGAGLPAATREYLERIKVSSHRMDTLITDALSYSKAVRENQPLVACLLYTSPSPRDSTSSRMPSSA